MKTLVLFFKVAGYSLLLYWLQLLKLIAAIAGLYLAVYGSRPLVEMFAGFLVGAIIVNLLAMILKGFRPLSEGGMEVSTTLGVLIASAVMLVELILGRHLIPFV